MIRRGDAAYQQYDDMTGERLADSKRIGDAPTIVEDGKRYAILTNFSAQRIDHVEVRA